MMKICLFIIIIFVTKYKNSQNFGENIILLSLVMSLYFWQNSTHVYLYSYCNESILNV